MLSAHDFSCCQRQLQVFPARLQERSDLEGAFQLTGHVGSSTFGHFLRAADFIFKSDRSHTGKILDAYTKQETK